MTKTYTKKELEYINKLVSNGMIRPKAEWYLNTMQTWTKEDYENYDKVHMEMLGEKLEEELEEQNEKGKLRCKCGESKKRNPK